MSHILTLRFTVKVTSWLFIWLAIHYSHRFYAYSWSSFVHFYKSLSFYFHYARHLQSSKTAKGREKKCTKYKNRESSEHLQPPSLSWVHYTSCGYKVLLCQRFITRSASSCCSDAVENVKSTWLITPSFIHFQPHTADLHSTLDNKKEWAFVL